jgi:glyoxylase-like metal-dependent hydrolase (beta-lactamase superfamily II)
MTEQSPEAVAVIPSQRRAWLDGVLGPPVPVAPDVWALSSPIPGGTLPYTLSYALASVDGVHVIDPGWDSDENLAALEASLQAIGYALGDVRTVIATHFHPDHLGICARVREASGAGLVLSAVDRQVLAQESGAPRRDPEAHAMLLASWGVPDAALPELLAHFDRPSLGADVEPDRLIDDGDVLELPQHRLTVVATPGHSDGHVCLVDEERELLYSGDHVLPEINPGIGIGTLPGSDPLAAYLTSLDRLAPWDGFRVLPGHEYVFDGLAARRRSLWSHHTRRTAEVAALIAPLGDSPIWEYARRLTWTAGWDGLHGFLLDSALRQTALHLEFVRSGRADEHLERFARGATH